MKNQQSIFINEMSDLTTDQYEIWVVGLLTFSPVMPIVPLAGEPFEQLMTTCKIWEETHSDKSEKYKEFTSAILHVFIDLFQPQKFDSLQADAPFHLNNLLSFLTFVPPIFKTIHKPTVGQILTQNRTSLQKIVYGDNRNIYLGLLNVYIDWANSESETIKGYEGTFEEFLYDNIYVWNTSEYMTIGLKYFIKYDLTNFSAFFIEGKHLYSDTDDFQNLLYSFKMFYHWQKQKALEPIRQCFLELYKQVYYSKNKNDSLTGFMYDFENWIAHLPENPTQKRILADCKASMFTGELLMPKTGEKVIPLNDFSLLLDLISLNIQVSPKLQQKFAH